MLRLPLDLYPIQDDFVYSPARFAGFVGGIGSGKSHAGAVKALLAAQPGSIGVVGAPTYGMLRDATLRSFRKVADPVIADFNKNEMLVTLINGAELLFRSTDNPEHLRGPNLDWAWLDEAALMTEETWRIMLGRLRKDGRLGPMWATTTPKGFNWVYDVFGPASPFVFSGEAALYTARTADNYFNHPDYAPSLARQYMGSYARQELDGAFVAQDGGLFKREWFSTVLDTRPVGGTWVRFWDLAVSVKAGADYTVGALVGLLDDGRLCVADVVRGRWEWPDARAVILATAASDGPTVQIGVEQVAFQLAAVQELARTPALLAYTVTASVPDRDKLARAMPWASRAALGHVLLVRGPWNTPFLAQLADFPAGPHDDDVDAVSGAVALLVDATREMRWS